MAITAIAARGTGVSSTSSTTFTMAPNATIAAGRYAFLSVSTDNTQTTTGTSTNHSSVTDTAGNTWSKVGEYTNGQSAAAAGVTVSLWMSQLTTQLTTGSTITVTLSTARVDKAMSLYEFSVGAGNTLQQVGSNQYQSVNATTGFGSSAFSSLTSKEYLFVRAMGKEANTTTALTVSSGFTAFTNTRSRNNTSAMTVYGEHEIITATGVTSNPTLAVSGDTASVFAAFEENISVQATLSATEDAETAASSAEVVVSASLSATEDSETITASAYIPPLPGVESLAEFFGELNGAEINALQINGDNEYPGIFEAPDTLVATASNLPVAVATANITEAADTLTSSATVPITAAATITEAGDTLSGAVTIPVTGSLNRTEAADTASAAGTIQIAASAAITEAPDTLSATGGQVQIVATASISEAPETLTAAGTVIAGATASIGEAADTVSAAGTVPLVATLNRTESPDTATGSATVPITASLTQTEAPDTASAAASVAVVATGTISEAPDTLAGAASVAVTASLAATEAPDTLVGVGNIGLLDVVATANITEAPDTMVALATVEGGEIAPPTYYGSGKHADRSIIDAVLDKYEAIDRARAADQAREKAREAQRKSVRYVEEIKAKALAAAQSAPLPPIESPLSAEARARRDAVTEDEQIMTAIALLLLDD